MSLHTKLLISQLLTLVADGRLEYREPIIGEAKPAPTSDKYDIAAREAADTKRQRKALRRARLNLPNAR